MKKGRVLAFVPMRSGSKGIIDKNILRVGEYPLFFYMVRSLVEAKQVSRVVVYTDSYTYAHLIKESFGSSVDICFRSKDSATDFASTEVAVMEYLRFYKPVEEFILLAQVTAPLVSSKMVDDFLIKFFSNSNKESMLSVVDLSNRFFWNEKGEPINYNFKGRERRQQLESERELLLENGALYINSKENWFLEKCRLTEPVDFFKMPEETLFEVDEEKDLVIVEKLLGV